MVLTIAILLPLTIAIAAFVLAPRVVKRRVIFDATPDRPAPFGLKMAWLAIRTRDTARVIDVLGLVNPRPCNWSSGIGTVYDDQLSENHVFVSPPVNGWTFVVGLSVPYPVGRRFVDKCTPMLLRLGAEFIEVQYFFSYPPIDFFAWARIIHGRLVRAFAIGDEGTIWNKASRLGTRRPGSQAVRAARVRERGTPGRADPLSDQARSEARRPGAGSNKIDTARVDSEVHLPCGSWRRASRKTA